MLDDLSLMDLAVQLHRSYDWTARNWRGLVASDGLPPPFIGGGAGSRPFWSREAVTAWKLRRQGDAGPGSLPQPTTAPAEPPPANDPTLTPPPAAGDRVSRLLQAAGGL